MNKIKTAEKIVPMHIQAITNLEKKKMLIRNQEIHCLVDFSRL